MNFGIYVESQKKVFESIYTIGILSKIVVVNNYFATLNALGNALRDVFIKDHKYPIPPQFYLYFEAGALV